MSTKIQISLSGFDALNLKQKADEQAKVDRQRYLEKQRLARTKIKGKQGKEKELANRGAVQGTGASQLPLSGRSLKSSLEDEFVPRLFESTNLLHLKVRNKIESQIFDYATFYGVRVQSLPFGGIRNYAALYYKGLFGIPNRFTIIKSQDFELRVPFSNQPLKSLVTSNNPGGIPTFGNDNGGRIIVYGSNSYDSLGTTYIVLPLGEKRCIVILLKGGSWQTVKLQSNHENENPPSQDENFFFPYRVGNIISFTANSDAFATNSAYLCTEYSIKEINIPQKLIPFMNVLNPQPYSFNGIIDESYLSGGEDFYFTYTGTKKDSSPSLGPTSEGLYRAGWTPSIFNAINELCLSNGITSPFPAGFIKQFPATKRWILPEEKYGWWKAWSEGAPETPPFVAYYSQWPIQNQEPTSEELGTIPLQTATFSELPGSGFLSDWPSGYNYSGIELVWDWDDPNYCQQACLALGFTAQDFIP